MVIGILGASGQVGTEVCLFLKTYPNLRVVAIVRTPVSGAMLRRCGVDVRVGRLGEPDESARLVGDCDVVVDFSAVSTGVVADIAAHYARNITAALRFSPATSRYVFISTINAFGMGDGFTRAKHYWISHSAYAYTKRSAERLAHRLARSLRKDAFVLRLGHVHGVLQRVSQQTTELVAGPYREFAYPSAPSYTVFCFSIAEAIANIAASKETPGTYTVVSEPAWSWKEVLEYYAPPGRAIVMRARGEAPASRRLYSAVERAVVGVASRYQETLAAHVLHRFPRLDAKARGYHYRRRARKQIAEWQDRYVYRPSNVHDGVFPGPRLRSMSDSRTTMAERTAEVRAILARLESNIDLSSDSVAVTSMKATCSR